MAIFPTTSHISLHIKDAGKTWSAWETSRGIRPDQMDGFFFVDVGLKCGCVRSLISAVHKTLFVELTGFFFGFRFERSTILYSNSGRNQL